jgi:hypothetical protein
MVRKMEAYYFVYARLFSQIAFHILLQRIGPNGADRPAMAQ